MKVYQLVLDTGTPVTQLSASAHIATAIDVRLILLCILSFEFLGLFGYYLRAS